MVPGGVNGDIWFMMALIFVLGFFIEWIEISYIVVPLFLPVLLKLNVDLVWVAMLIAVNLQTSFLTPPFGWALFYLRGVAPPEVDASAHLQGVVPFIGLQGCALVLVFIYPADRASGCPRRSAGEEAADMIEPRPPLPPFDEAGALHKVRGAEDAWNTRDPRSACASTPRTRAGATAPSSRSGATRCEPSCSASGRANSTTG